MPEKNYYFSKINKIQMFFGIQWQVTAVSVELLVMRTQPTAPNSMSAMVIVLQWRSRVPPALFITLKVKCAIGPIMYLVVVGQELLQLPHSPLPPQRRLLPEHHHQAQPQAVQSSATHKFKRSFFCQIGGTTSGGTVTGVCSYYGGPEEPGDTGAYTADGEIYNPNLDTAAAMANYPWGAFNTTIFVYCADTGLSVTVRVNDRGNFAPRVLDLSYHAGTTIGITSGKGLCNTCVLTW
jgi:hypothetical protein